MSEIKRKKGESFESYMRRVKRVWQLSGRILEARKRKFYDPGKSKNMQRKKAINRAKTIAKTNYLRKIGRLPADEEPFGTHGTQPRRP